MADNIPSIRMLGTTWKARKAPYWIRRAALSFIGLLLAFAVGLAYVSVAVGLLRGASGNVTAQVAIVAVFVVAFVWSTAAAVNAYRPILAAERAKDIEALRAIAARKSSRKSKAGNASGLGLGLGALAGGGFALALISFGSVFIVGWPIVMFLMSLRRYYSAEECLAVLESGRKAVR